MDVIQPDLAASGGLTNARRVAVVAEAFQVDFQPHIFGTVLALPAVVQLMASITNNQPWMLFPRPVLLEWDTTRNPMAQDLLKNPPPVDGRGAASSQWPRHRRRGQRGGHQALPDGIGRR